ncbi:MAG TPA: porin [Thermodesulfobacteriota bacterium]|nr:porin [Thermodesulfobacteriota bacterium]
MKETFKGIHRTKYFRLPIFFLILLILAFWGKPELAFAEQDSTQTPASGQSELAPKDTDEKYHTPLAGEPFQLEFLGRSIAIPARDRGNLTSLELGTTAYFPELADTAAAPLFALFLRRTWEKAQLRIVASAFVNEVDGARSFGHPEIVARFENYTIPFSEKGFRRNEVVDESAVKWGTLSGFLGAGLRYPVAPYQVDNDLRLQVLGRVGYLYSKKTSETGPDVKLPPDTMLYGVKLRGRYDGIRRNLLELPHTGMAAGFNLDFVHRENWADYGNAIITFPKDESQNYYIASGYLMGVFGIPGLSEKNRLLASVHGSYMDKKSADRYNATRLDGGPLAQERDDLARPNYPGALDTVTLVSKYLLLNLEYRRELLPFLYLELRGAFIWGDRSTIIALNQIGFKSDKGQTAAVALTSGFLWKSQLYIEYAWDTGFLRDGKAGSTVTFLWSKAF